MNGGYLTVDGYWIRVFSFLKRAQQISGQISFGDQHRDQNSGHVTSL